MNLSKSDNMFTEGPFGENDGENRAASSPVDLDFGIGKLSVSPEYESTCLRTDESSGIMAASDLSGTGGLLSAFDSISFAEKPLLRNGIAKGTPKSDDIGSVYEANLHGQRPNEEQGSSTHDSSDCSRIHGPSSHGDAEAEDVDEIERTQKSNDHLIVYTSSRRNTSRNTYAELNQNNDFKEQSTNCRVMDQNNSLSDLESLQIARRKRSLLSKRAKSSVWGLVSLPASKQNTELEPCLGNVKKVGSLKGGKAKKNAIKDLTGQKPVIKSSTPTGRISLKIRIGNQSCGVVNVAEKIVVSGKNISGSCHIKDNKYREEFPGDMLLSNGNNLGNVTEPDASALGMRLDVAGSVKDKSLGGSTENGCLDPGTSPDSEVINSVPDPPLCERVIEDMQDSPVMPTEKGLQGCFADSVAGFPKSSLKMQSRKGKKTTGAETKHNVRVSMDSGLRQRVLDISKCDNVSILPTGSHLHNAQSRDGVPSSPAGCSGTNNLENPCSTSKKACGDSEVNPSPQFSDATEPSMSQVHKSLSNGKKNLKCSRAKGGCRSSGILDFPPKKSKASKKKGDSSNLVSKDQISLKEDASGVLSRVESHLEAGNQTLPHPEEVGYVSTHSAGSEFVSSSGRLNCQYAPPRNAWVLCDECQKWRRIAATLADQIDQTNCRWTCKDNADVNFADCSIPQEKSNSEINEELDISDASGDENAGGKLQKSTRNKSTAVNKQSSWTLIKSNLFLHRRRKTQNIDEVMVCHCKPPSDGRMGCGAKCLNRLLNIECVKGTCPCGELCSNQQFQKRMYAKLKSLRCGKKGFGLQALQDISEGQFLIEYVGEVLDIHTHEARQREYALQGHKHFYFMTLNGSEVIDACAKGNLGRFINHSCDPNCVTEKWMVNGEVCVGLFAIRDIKKGEEVTFDYNFVRVLGAAAKKCVCGSPNCRGYIGGDPTNSEVIVQEDSDDEFAEPVMICDDRVVNNDWTDVMSQSLLEKENKNKDELEEERRRMKNVNGSAQSESITSETSLDKLGVKPSSNGCSKAATATRVVDVTGQDKYEPDNSDSSVSATLNTESDTSSPVSLIKASLQSEEVMNNAVPPDLHLDNELKISSTRLPAKLQPDAVKSKKKLKYGTMRVKDEFAKSDSLAKNHQSSPLIRKGKFKSNAVKDKGALDGDKSNAVRHKSKKLPGLAPNSHLEAVEGKLNELLDTEGGISKRRDASRGYLKLLFLTAASGTNGHGEAIQSNRDLSMILDALLKTKSRTVLVDIINKNGLQMLHNIMKRYRKEFIKTPILRKLLKVLEYLAMREILTLEHIAGGPPRPGAESFKDSILTLTEHDDKQVHQIARNFRDKWIPKSLRKICFTPLDDANKVFRQQSTYGKLSVSTDHWNDRSGKHTDSVESCDKQPSVASGVTSTVDPSPASGCSTATNGTRTRKRKSRWDIPMEECKHPKITTSLSDDGKPNFDNDAPPGFSSPCTNPMVPSTALNQHQRDTSSKHPTNILLAVPSERFISHLPLSYGVPYSIAQQFGIREGEAAPVFSIAPGLPFHPFPPLPPCNKEEQPSATGQDNVSCAASYSGNKRRMPCSSDTPEMSVKANEHPGFQPEEGSNNLARKYFKQQKWNHSKIPPPWLRMRNGWGQPRNGGVDFGNGANQFTNGYTPEDVNWRGEF